MPIINRISEFHEKMIEWRQDIHSHPELAYQEKRTARKVADLLKEFGVDEINEGIGGNGEVGVIKNGVGIVLSQDLHQVLEGGLQRLARAIDHEDLEEAGQSLVPAEQLHVHD